MCLINLLALIKSVEITNVIQNLLLSFSMFLFLSAHTEVWTRNKTRAS